MHGLFKNIRSRPFGIALGVGVPLMVIVWHFLALAARPSHLDKIVAELGSTMRFWADPIPNHACTRLIFIQTTEHGYGVYFSEAPGKRKLVFEQPCGGAGYGNLDESLMGWSPDDKFFAYGRHRNDWEIVICDGDTGADVAVVPFNHYVAGAAWLTPELVAFADSEKVLHTMRKYHEQWVRPQPFAYFTGRSHKLPTADIRGFTAFDTNTVVWRQGGTLFACTTDNTNDPVKLWQSTTNSIATNTLLESSFSQASSKFLVRCRDNNGQYFAWLYPKEQDGQITGVTSAEASRITRGEFRPNHLSVINKGEGYAFLTQTGTTPDTLVIKPDDSHPPIEFQWQDQVRNFAAGEKAIYVVSSLNDEPTGIYRYDLASGSAECVVPNVEKPFGYAKNSHITAEGITNGAGEKLTYYLLAPANETDKRKHPLVIGILGIGEMGFSWSANLEAIANCGAYFVSLDRRGREQSKWGDDAFAVYQALAKRPDIDTNRVSLYSDSAGTTAVYELLEKNPKLWRGAVLFSPGRFPDPSRIPGSRIFIDNGGDDAAFGKEGMKVPMRFQDEAAQAGIPVTLIIHPGLGHTFRMPAGERERMREALVFLNEN